MDCTMCVECTCEGCVNELVPEPTLCPACHQDLEWCNVCEMWFCTEHDVCICGLEQGQEGTQEARGEPFKINQYDCIGNN